MNHHRTLEGISLQRAWLTIGVFDGLHRGHQDLVRRLVSGAHAAGAPAVVLTFFPHPAVVLGRQANFSYLTLPDEKAARLGVLGVDRVITLPFTPELASQSAEAFMQAVAAALGVEQLLIGYDFALGRNREGNAARLTELGERFGYRTEIVPPFQVDGRVISSSAIRTQLLAGQVAKAAEGLGRRYRVGGPVIHGDGRGRHINMPTANIAFPPEKLIPAAGIYATWAWLDGERFPGATNIGINPTFTPERTSTSLETHLLDFHGDLYGRGLSLEFVARLRGEEKFASVEALLAQIRDDIARTREILKAAGMEPSGDAQ
jgi:riboflavin kinase/FMN adenylyltransferase